LSPEKSEYTVSEDFSKIKEVSTANTSD